MAKKSGRGKQSFRDFTRTANSLKRHIISAFKSGEVYTDEQLQSFYQDILYDYSNTLETDRLDYELWYVRAENKAQEDIDYLRDTYPNNVDNGNGETEEDIEPDDFIEDGEIPNSILGYPVITDHECLDSESGVPRGQILLSLEDLAEYLQPIPGDAIIGIILRFNEDKTEIKGFSVCIGATI